MIFDPSFNLWVFTIPLAVTCTAAAPYVLKKSLRLDEAGIGLLLLSAARPSSPTSCYKGGVAARFHMTPIRGLMEQNIFFYQ